MTIGGVTFGIVDPVGWILLAYWTLRLRYRGHDWSTIVPAVTLQFLAFTLRKPETLSEIIFWTSLGIILWLLWVGGGGGGPKRRRKRAQAPERETTDWSGTAVPA